MKKSVVLGTLLLSGLIALAVPAPARASVSVNLAYFHQTLSPHGQWVVSTSYGEVWQPAVAAGWEPYVDGEWQYTDWGWTCRARQIFVVAHRRTREIVMDESLRLWSSAC